MNNNYWKPLSQKDAISKLNTGLNRKNESPYKNYNLQCNKYVIVLLKGDK